jgi:exodeoxyribonuclease V alpha subunit
MNNVFRPFLSELVSNDVIDQHDRLLLENLTCSRFYFFQLLTYTISFKHGLSWLMPQNGYTHAQILAVINNVVRDQTLDYVKQWRLAIHDIDESGETLKLHPYLKKIDAGFVWSSVYKRLFSFHDSLNSFLNEKPVSTISIPLESYFSDEQTLFFKAVMNNTLTVLVGGPGSGKTFVASHAIGHMLKQGLRVTVTAPTGKAVSQLENAIGTQCDSNPRLLFGTLHSLLHRHSKQLTYNELPMDTDVLIIDEASMIDLRMWTFIFRVVHPKTRVICVGDPLQLPPVESMDLFCMICRYLDSQLYGGYVTLTRIMRAEHDDLISLATDIRYRPQDLEQIITRSQSVTDNVLSLNPQELIQYADNAYGTDSSRDNINTNFHEMMDQLIFLTPFRKGKWGYEYLNDRLLDKILMRQESLNIPIVITENDSQNGIFNGQNGIIKIRFDDSYPFVTFMGRHLQARVEYYIIKKENGQPSPIKMTRQYTYQLRWFMSIHKSQGSAFDTVHIVLPEQSNLFGLSLLYTALTRAKRNVIIHKGALQLDEFGLFNETPNLLSHFVDDTVMVNQ